MATFKLTKKQLEACSPEFRKLLEESEVKAKEKAKAKAKNLVTPHYDGNGTWTLPIETVSEANQRGWRKRSSRSSSAWKIVRRHVKLRDLIPYEEAAQEGKKIKCVFTRLGGKSLDSLVNLPSAMKACEDAVCYMLGIDDGKSELWSAKCEQEVGGDVGVRISLEVEELCPDSCSASTYSG